MRVTNVMLSGKRGGLEQAAIDYCQTLRTLGHTVSIVIRDGAAIAPQLEDTGLTVHRLRAPYRWNLLAVWQLRSLLRAQDMTITHGNRAGSLLNATWRRGPNHIAVVHSRFFRPYRTFQGFITMTACRANELQQRTGKPAYVVPNKVHMPPVRPRPAWRTPPVIGSMGRFDPIKGYDLLLHAVSMLHAQGLPVRLHMAGCGPKRRALRSLAAKLGIAEHVTWLGWVQDKDSFFDDIDLFCLSSRYDTFPLAVLEAMGHGVPCIATDQGGAVSILADGCGILTACTAESIAEGLRRALYDSAATRAMGEAARERAATAYSEASVARRLHEAMQTLTSAT